MKRLYAARINAMHVPYANMKEIHNHRRHQEAVGESLVVDMGP